MAHLCLTLTGLTTFWPQCIWETQRRRPPLSLPSPQAPRALRGKFFPRFSAQKIIDHSRIETLKYLMKSDIYWLQGRCARNFVCSTCVGPGQAERGL